MILTIHQSKQASPQALVQMGMKPGDLAMCPYHQLKEIYTEGNDGLSMETNNYQCTHPMEYYSISLLIFIQSFIITNPMHRLP